MNGPMAIQIQFEGLGRLLSSRAFWISLFVGCCLLCGRVLSGTPVTLAVRMDSHGLVPGMLRQAISLIQFGGSSGCLRMLRGAAVE